jgi:enamine deaminase RidA (YjgF/YER057c/UK114 family)
MALGPHVLVSGIVGVDPSTGSLAGDTIQDQTRQALTNCQAILQAGGASLDDVIEVGILLTNPADFAGLNEEYARWFPSVVLRTAATRRVSPGMRRRHCSDNASTAQEKHTRHPRRLQRRRPFRGFIVVVPVVVVARTDGLRWRAAPGQALSPDGLALPGSTTSCAQGSRPQTSRQRHAARSREQAACKEACIPPARRQMRPFTASADDVCG